VTRTGIAPSDSHNGWSRRTASELLLVADRAVEQQTADAEVSMTFLRQVDTRCKRHTPAAAGYWELAATHRLNPVALVRTKDILNDVKSVLSRFTLSSITLPGAFGRNWGV
jgi:hypothetical protein